MNYVYNETFCKAFGIKVREIRKNKKLSMRKLAVLADIEYSQLSRIELGQINTTISSAYNLAQALDVAVSTLFEFN